MNIEKLDALDDMIFDLAQEVNETLEIGANIPALNHTELVINIREFIADEIERQANAE